MINDEVMTNLRIAHGSYNIFVMMLFFYQGFLGLRIRIERKKGNQYVRAIRKHRKSGPVLVGMGIAGFFAGLTVVYIDHGNILKFPYHLIAGSILMASILIQLFISRKINPSAIGLRDKHFMVGIIIICLYLIQALLGVNLLKQHKHEEHDHAQYQQQ